MNAPLHHTTYKYRVYPSRVLEAALVETLARCCELYNAALQERRDAYRMARKSLNYYDQATQLPTVKEVRPEYRDIHSQVLQDVLRRVDKAYHAFFARVKAGRKPGFPRFQGRNRFTSFTYPQYGNGATLHYDGSKWGMLTLSKIGTLKVRMHRPVEGTIKTVTLRRDGDQWYVCFSVLVEAAPLPATTAATGIDLGLVHFATLADGATLDNPRHLRRGLKKLARVQRALSRCKRGSHRRQRVRRAVARLHRRVRNARTDFCHKAARTVVNRYGTIVLEDLAIRNMVRNHALALSISDAGWGLFVQYVSDKAAWAGRNVCFVNPQFTSQRCSTPGCMGWQKLTLADRWYSCPVCGLELDRDVNAARNILRLGRSQRDHLTVEA